MSIKMFESHEQVRRRLRMLAKDLFDQIDEELNAFDPRTRDAAAGYVDLLIEKSPVKVPDVAPVPRGHCGRCDRCGWPLADKAEAGCVIGNCSLRRPGVWTSAATEPRSTCAGCGAPFEGATK